MKRVFSILLATIMVVSMMAVPAFAGEVDGRHIATLPIVSRIYLL